jgi:hypothetical protein
MATTDPRIDAYIERAAPFAQPLLRTLRTAVHAACPGVVETIKWGMPFFMHGPHILAHMAAFKQHASFGFWHGRAAADQGRDGEAMGQFGRITKPSDLPSAAELKALVRAVVARIDAEVAATGKPAAVHKAETVGAAAARKAAARGAVKPAARPAAAGRPRGASR